MKIQPHPVPLSLYQGILSQNETEAHDTQDAIRSSEPKHTISHAVHKDKQLKI